jgi:DNA-binding NarL/FixJ family response regulator
MKPIRVVLADDHQLVRAGFRALLQRLEGVQVVGEARDGLEALQLIRELRPDAVLLDLMMPGLNGLEATYRIAQEAPEVRVLILTMNATDELVTSVVRAGASGFLLKTAEPVELEQALRAVARGDVYVSPAVSRAMVNACRSQEPDLLSRLTPRQRDVLRLVAEGNSSKEIARRLNLTPRTVEAYRAQVMELLDIRDVAGLTRFAIRVGLTNKPAATADCGSRRIRGAAWPSGGHRRWTGRPGR